MDVVIPSRFDPLWSDLARLAQLQGQIGGPRRIQRARYKPAHQMRVWRPRMCRATAKPHVGVAGRAAGLAQIAGSASRHQVVPPASPAETPWHYVVNCHVGVARTAVLAGVGVAHQNLAAAQSDRRSRPAHVVPQPDDARPWNVASRCAQRSLAVRQRFGLALGQQHDRASHAADVQRLVVLIQQQNRRIHRPPTRRA